MIQQALSGDQHLRGADATADLNLLHFHRAFLAFLSKPSGPSRPGEASAQIRSRAPVIVSAAKTTNDDIRECGPPPQHNRTKPGVVLRPDRVKQEVMLI